MEPVVPFRWSLSGARLPDLARVPAPAEPWPGYRADLLALAARVVVACGDADPVFVGRSCESVFDLLSALLEGTPHAGSPRLLLVSVRGPLGERGLCSRGLRATLAAAQVDPDGLLRRPRPAALVDVVATGETFHRVLRAIRIACRERRLGWRGARRKLRLVAVRSQGSARERDWHASLVGVANRIQQVNVPDRLWNWLGAGQPKVTPAHTPAHWDDPAAGRPRGRQPERMAALRAAVELAAWGRERATREAFARHVGRAPGWHVRDERWRAGSGWPDRRRSRGLSVDDVLAEYDG